MNTPTSKHRVNVSHERPPGRKRHGLGWAVFGTGDGGEEAVRSSRE